MKKFLMALTILFSTLFISNIAYAETNITVTTESLKWCEQALNEARSHYNLTEDDILENNLSLGDIYLNNSLNLDDTNSYTIPEDNMYVSTLYLKTPNKPIALAYIEKFENEFNIVKLSSYNYLDNEINKLKTSTNEDPTVIIDDRSGVLGLINKSDPNEIFILDEGDHLGINSGDVRNTSDLIEEIKELISTETTDINTGHLSSADNNNNSNNLLTFTFIIISISSIFLYNKIYKNKLN